MSDRSTDMRCTMAHSLDPEFGGIAGVYLGSRIQVQVQTVAKIKLILLI
jgi:hypothetical protein